MALFANYVHTVKECRQTLKEQDGLQDIKQNSLLGSRVSSYSCRYIQIRKWQIVDSLPRLLRFTEIALYHLNETQFSLSIGELIQMVLEPFYSLMQKIRKEKFKPNEHENREQNLLLSNIAHAGCRAIQKHHVTRTHTWHYSGFFQFQHVSSFLFCFELGGSDQQCKTRQLHDCDPLQLMWYIMVLKKTRLIKQTCICTFYITNSTSWHESEWRGSVLN